MIQSTLAPASTSSDLEFSLSGPAGRFDFRGFEVPERLDSLGGEEITALHQFVGGRRVIQTFGSTPVSMISWDGMFLGEGTFVRAALLDGFRRAGLQLILTYGAPDHAYKFSGVLKSVRIKPGHEGNIPYSASFQPDTDLSEKPALTQSSISAEISVAQATAQADGLAASYLATGTNPYLATQCALVAGSILVLQDNIASAAGLIAGVSSTLLAGNIASLSAYASTLLNFALNNTPIASDITDVTAASSDAIAAIQLYAQVQQIVNMLTGLLTPKRLLTITVSNPNLFVLAAQYYGDAGKWNVISNANGYLPPFNAGVFSLVIPQ